MSGDAPPDLPKPSFEVLVQVLATPCFVHLGLMENPATGKREKDLSQARWALDLLHVVEEVTKDNLSAEQNELLERMLHELRGAYMSARD